MSGRPCRDEALLEQELLHRRLVVRALKRGATLVMWLLDRSAPVYLYTPRAGASGVQWLLRDNPACHVGLIRLRATHRRHQLNSHRPASRILAWLIALALLLAAPSNQGLTLVPISAQLELFCPLCDPT